MLGKVGGWVIMEGLSHTELWVKYNLPYVNTRFLHTLFIMNKYILPCN